VRRGGEEDDWEREDGEECPRPERRRRADLLPEDARDEARDQKRAADAPCVDAVRRPRHGSVDLVGYPGLENAVRRCDEEPVEREERPGEARVDEVVARVRKDDERGREPQVVRSQEQERVRRVPEREHARTRDDPPIAGAEPRLHVRRVGLHRRLVHAADEEDGKEPGDDRDPQHRAQRGSSGEEGDRQERADGRAGRVEGAVEAEARADELGRCRVADERVARRAPHRLPGAIDEPDPLDETEHGDRSAEHDREEERDDRVGELAREVVHEGDDAHRPDVGRDPADPPEHGRTL
jgi:hypothetical protein